MASKKTQSVKKEAPKAKAPAKAAKAAPKAPKVAAKPTGPRHPKARVAAAHGSKADLAKSLASLVARGGEDAGAVETKLKTASNAQLLRLSRAAQTVKDRFGSREKLIAAIGTASKKSKDKDYLAKLDSYSLPQLLDLAPKRAAAAAK
ncbi:MAG TPA: hypothetical protein VFP84_19070 [Kofleriaceae bacterium]|nr:hypothetical protein [Kofleriaceae bacterium]